MDDFSIEIWNSHDSGTIMTALDVPNTRTQSNTWHHITFTRKSSIFKFFDETGEYLKSSADTGKNDDLSQL